MLTAAAALPDALELPAGKRRALQQWKIQLHPACCPQLLAREPCVHVVAAARRPAASAELCALQGQAQARLTLVPLNLASQASIQARAGPKPCCSALLGARPQVPHACPFQQVKLHIACKLELKHHDHACSATCASKYYVHGPTSCRNMPVLGAHGKASRGGSASQEPAFWHDTWGSAQSSAVLMQAHGL